jgi:ferrous iron transport protein A
MGKPLSMTLDQLKENESGIIQQINDEDLAIQLLSMGFVLGEKVKVDRIAPLKDPILITSGTSYISIRNEDAQKIEVIV